MFRHARRIVAVGVSFALVIACVLACSKAAQAASKPPATGKVQFKSSAYSVTENGGTVRIYVSRTGGSSGVASVAYATANGTATAGSDYTAKSGTLNWSSGDAADKSFDVTILNDGIYEGDETFTVTLSGATGATLGSPTSTTVTITDDDAPAPNPQYEVLDLGVVRFDSGYPESVMNDQGQVVCIAGYWEQPQVVVLTPRDGNADGFWDSVSELKILMPDRAWFETALGLTPDQEVDVAFLSVEVGHGGVVSGTIDGYVYRPSDDEYLYEFYRGFVVKPADSDGDGINDAALTDLGVGQVDPDGGDIEYVLTTSVYDMNESGCIVGNVGKDRYNEIHNPVYPDCTTQAFRIVPRDTDGDGIGDIWFEDINADGVNDLIELLGATGSSASVVDDVGRVYVSNPDRSGFVVLPDDTSSVTKSPSDQMFIEAGNRGGLAVGYYRTGRQYRGGVYSFPVEAPCLIQGVDTDGNGNPDLWFRDDNNDGKNDLMINLGTLSGYADKSYATAANDRGEIVGFGYYSTSKGAWGNRALIWKNQVAVDLNTLVSQPSVALREAVAITQAGAILCNGTDSTGAWHCWLLMPIAAP
jgi:hypothetical protein